VLIVEQPRGKVRQLIAIQITVKFEWTRSADVNVWVFCSAIRFRYRINSGC
jgi:hypothetical protein